VFAVGALDNSADCPKHGATSAKVASEIVRTPEIALVYFMLEKSNFFTLNRVQGHFQTLCCTPGTEWDAAPDSLSD
jgi:hypothetical protein